MNLNEIYLIISLAICIIVIILLLSRKNTPSLPANFFNDLGKINELQNQLKGGFDEFSKQNNEKLSKLHEKITHQEQQISDRLSKTSTEGKELMGDVKERLAKIITAQTKIDSLSDSVLDLKKILDDKQKRGIYGEAVMMDLIKNYLPASGYSFQKKLSNGKVADCILHFPTEPGNLVIDAKFHMEDYKALIESQNDEEVKKNTKGFKNSILKSANDIAEKYIIAGETAPMAIMFVPSETIYGEIFVNHPDIIREANKKKVFFASPNTFMALLATMRAVLKDTQMLKQSSEIQKELEKLLVDIGRLDERLDRLEQSHKSMGKIIEEVSTSGRKINKHVHKITSIDIDEDPALIENERAPLLAGTESNHENS